MSVYPDAICPFRCLHTFHFLRPARHYPRFLGYGAPHSSTRGTLTLLNNALLSTRDGWVGLKPPERLQASRGRRSRSQRSAKKTTLKSERRSALKKDLTGPTLLEMGTAGGPGVSSLTLFHAAALFFLLQLLAGAGRQGTRILQRPEVANGEVKGVTQDARDGCLARRSDRPPSHLDFVELIFEAACNKKSPILEVAVA